jgi:hypothetical protein
MRRLFTSLVLALAATAALAEITYTVKATRNGKPIPASEIVIERKPPSLHRLERAADERPKPPNRGNKVKRTNAVSYSSNWCGAVQGSPSTNKITSVYGWYQVPTLSARPGVSSFPQYVATWAGIDGATWGSALLQSGTASEVGNLPKSTRRRECMR